MYSCRIMLFIIYLIIFSHYVHIVFSITRFFFLKLKGIFIKTIKACKFYKENRTETGNQKRVNQNKNLTPLEARRMASQFAAQFQ